MSSYTSAVARKPIRVYHLARAQASKGCTGFSPETQPRVLNSRVSQEEAREERKFIRGYIFRAWGPTWCRMLGSNVFACVADTTRGIRRVNTSAARTGPQRDVNPPTLKTAER